MRWSHAALLTGFAWLACVPAPSSARERTPDRLTVAAGMIVAPDYEGSDDYIATVATGAVIHVHGHTITWRGDALSADLVPEYRDQRFKIVAGPMVELNFDRAVAPRDSVVALTRRRKTAVQGGGFIGFTRTGLLTSDEDRLTFTLTGTYDLGNVHHSMVVTPTLDYVMPLSRTVVIEASVSADVVGGRYARYYFGVGRTSSLASGLPRYQPDGGIKSVSVGLGGAVALNGDLNRRGVLLGAMANYERLMGQFPASPIVADRGNANQASLALGAAYRF